MSGKKSFSNSCVFDKIGNTEAYFLGLYFADGCICKTTQNRKIISIGLNDRTTIRKVCKFYGIPYNQIKEYRYAKNKINYRLQFCNNNLFDRLKNLGCVERKSNILGSPKINQKHYLSFLMGVFDGDGSLSCNQTINQWKAMLCTGSLAFLNFIKKVLDLHCLLYYIEVRKIKSGSFYVITLSGLSAKVFLDKIYASVPANLPMKHKKQKYNRLKKNKFRPPRYCQWELKYLTENTTAEKCSEKIITDARNLGWTRSVANIKRTRRKLKNDHKS